MSDPHRKTIQRYHDPGDIHELTFSVYKRQKLLRRKLCQKARDWRWSSARFYDSEGRELDPLHPVLTFLPYEFWL